MTATRECGYRRTQWYNPMIDVYEANLDCSETMVPCDPQLPGLESVEPNLVSSRLYFEGSQFARGSSHSPVLDIDFAARLVPSSTEGHFHLYLDGLTLSWPEYENLLSALADAGVIERGYFDASVRRQMTCVRPPGMVKGA